MAGAVGKAAARGRLRWLAAVLAALLACLAPRSFCARPGGATLAGRKPPGFLTQATTASGHLPSRGDLTGFRAQARDFGGQRSEGLLTACVAALSTCAMSVLQTVVHRQIWVPPFGAVALIFAAESVAAAKQGKLMCRKTVGNRALKACSGVATACVCTVALAQLCGSPTLMRTIVMFAAAYSMVLNPGADYFPPAGALCALFVEKAVVVGKPSLLPGFEYALFPCAVGVGLLLLFSRLIAFVLARAHWALLPSRDAQDREPLLSKA